MDTTVHAIELPDQAWTLARTLADYYKVPTSLYLALCVITGLSDQLRFTGPPGMALAENLAKLGETMARDAGMPVITVKLPPEVRSIMQYEVDKQSPA